MPQLSQLSEVYLSQFLWLAIALGFIFFVIARGMVPKIQATVEAREQQIAGDLEAAQKARAAADETEAAWRARMDAARAEAARIAQEAKQAERARHRSEGQGRGRQDQSQGRSRSRRRSARRSLRPGPRSKRSRPKRRRRWSGASDRPVRSTGRRPPQR